MNPHDTSPLPTGTRIGGDVVEDVLGMGSFGTMYRVRNPEGHPAALKLVPLEEDGVGAERARREASLGERLPPPISRARWAWANGPRKTPASSG